MKLGVLKWSEKEKERRKELLQLNRLKTIKIHRCFQTHTNKLKPNKGRKLEA